MSQINELKKQVTDLLYEELSKESRTYAGAYAGKIADKVLKIFFGWLGSLQEDVSIEDKAKEDNNMFRFELGEALEDTDTGFQGFVVSRVEAFSAPFGREGIVKTYLLYNIPGLLTFFAPVKGGGILNLEYGWYDERNLTRVGRKMKIE